MIPSLRDYQQDMIQRTRGALRHHRRVLLQAPTGAGKTVLAAFMAGSATSKSLRTWFICHRRELIKQASRTFSDVGIPHGFVAAGMTPDRRQPVQVCGIQTLAGRLDRYEPPDLIIWDECHHISAGTWSKVANAYGKAKHVGLSATPTRLDGSGLDKHFDALVPGPQTAWLIENGYLSPFRLYAPTMPDLTGIHSRGGDYAKDELSDAMSKPSIIGDVVEHYRRLAHGRRNMIFCVSVKHSLAVVEKFESAGYRAAHIDGETDAAERDRLIAQFTSGAIQVLSSVDLVSEGFDLPAIEVATLLRPTKSLSLYLQQVGRALRMSPGKSEAIILDHAGNAMKANGEPNHGLPDDERTWSLAGRLKRKRGQKSDDEPGVAVRQCPVCYGVHRPAPVCPRCGHEYPAMGRSVEELEGELMEITRQAAKVEARREQGKAQTLDDLIRIGTLRGYKNPKFWARKIIEGRQHRARGY